MKKGFIDYLLHAKYSYHDFFEALLALPFGYALLRILEGRYNTLTFVIVFVLFLVYLPAIVVFIESRGKR